MIELYNQYHLGDCVIDLHFLRNVVDNDRSKQFRYYVNDVYIQELSNHIIGYENNILILALSNKTSNSINTWIGNQYNLNYFNCEYSYNYNVFYLDWFKQLSNIINVPYTLSSMVYNYDGILKNKSNKSYNIIIVNSVGLSCGLNHDYTKWEELSTSLSKKYSIITTNKINGIECTLDTNMNLVQIAGCSINSEYIIGIHTSPIHLCFNKWNINNLKKVFVLDYRNTFSYITDTERIDYSQFDKIYEYFNV